MIERTPYLACPLCDASELTDVGTGNCSHHPLYHPSLSPNIHWKQCRACSHVFTAGYFTPEACQLIFSKTNENQQVGYGIEQQRGISARMVEKVIPFVSAGRWLDIGFGNGSLLFTAQEYGFLATGLDLRQENVQRAREMGIDAYCADVADFTPQTPCSVISMADVLEHIPYPRTALAAAHRILTDNGILLISMPNLECAVWRQLDQQNANPYWGELEHYHNFGRTRLYALLRQHDFEPLRYGISERYRACMEIVARKRAKPAAPAMSFSYAQNLGG